MNDAERLRVQRVIDSVQLYDWHMFETLTDAPFLNKDSMIEQFDHAHNSIVFPVAWEKNYSVNASSKGRFIEVFFPTKTGSSIKLMMFNSEKGGLPKIEVWGLSDSAWSEFDNS